MIELIQSLDKFSDHLLGIPRGLRNVFGVQLGLTAARLYLALIFYNLTLNVAQRAYFGFVHLQSYSNVR